MQRAETLQPTTPVQLIIAKLRQHLNSCRVFTRQEKNQHEKEIKCGQHRTLQEKLFSANGKGNKPFYESVLIEAQKDQNLHQSFNVLPATLERLIFLFEKMETDLPSRFYCEIIDDEELGVDNSTIAHNIAEHLAKIINGICPQFCIATVIIGSIEQKGPEMKRFSSYYRLRIGFLKN